VTSLQVNEPPPWLATFAAEMNQKIADLTAELNGIKNILRYEMPIRLANSSRHPTVS
jgi:hypothetical protein